MLGTDIFLLQILTIIYSVTIHAFEIALGIIIAYLILKKFNKI